MKVIPEIDSRLIAPDPLEISRAAKNISLIRVFIRLDFALLYGVKQ
jgi:hypothetical protein